ncbi:UNVERIFIED_CONTAM: hypothetical protein K2H54_021265 [Gekko kuhli]
MGWPTGALELLGCLCGKEARGLVQEVLIQYLGLASQTTPYFFHPLFSAYLEGYSLVVLGVGQSFTLRIRLSESSAQAKESSGPFKGLNLFGEGLNRYLTEDKESPLIKKGQ